MASLVIFTFFVFFSFLSTIASTSCSGKCSSHGPKVRYPFWIRHHGRIEHHCGTSGTAVSCNDQKQTVIYHEYSRTEFIVQEINYLDQIVLINDPSKCLIKRFIDNQTGFGFSPFSYLNDFGLYSFLNCSPKAEQVTSHPILSCLSNDNYKVIAVPSSLSRQAERPAPLLSDFLCSEITEAMIPIKPRNHKDPPNPSDWENLNFGVQLKWDDFECQNCEASGRHCQLDGSGQVDCASTNTFSQLPKAARITIWTGFIVSVLLCVLTLTLRLTRIQDQQLITELSTGIVNRQSPLFTKSGLDGATIESYPKTQLGESRELPNSNDNTCPICLGEYQPKETLRTIPQCNHFFHASCIDEWLRKNPTCPICRNPPEGEQNKSLNE